MTRVFAILLSLSAITSAAPPVATINGPADARIGDIVILDASGSSADHFAWSIDATAVQIPNGKSGTDTDRLAEQLRSLGFKVEKPVKNSGPLTHLVLNDGKMLILASYQGEWRVALAVGNADGVSIRPWTVKVSGAESPPDDPPDVTDPPNVPDAPKSPFGLRENVRNWLKGVPAASQGQTSRLADVIDFFVMQSRAGSYKTIKDADQALLNFFLAEQQAGRMTKADWAAFGVKLMDTMQGLQALGRITDVETNADAFAEVAAAMREGA